MSSARSGLLFIVNSLGVGGAEKQVVTLLNHLDTQHFRLHLACLKRNDSLLPQLDVRRLEKLVCCEIGQGIELKGIEQLRQLMRDSSIDVVVCTNMYAMLYGALAIAGLPARPKLVTVFHTTLLRTYKEKVKMLFYRHIFKRCDLLMYVCENQSRYWRERGLRAHADTVVYNGIDVNYFSERLQPERIAEVRRSLRIDPGDYVIGLCSALRPEKAHGDLLRSVVLMRERGVRAVALFIGDGPERPVIESLIDELGIRDQVRITGIQQDVRPFVACCDVMTLASRSVETFSLAALESMALRKPLVMSDIGGASEQVIHGENGFLFEAGNIEDLAQHLTALRSEALRVRMGAASAERVRRLFTVEQMARGFSDRMTALLERSGTLARPSAALRHD
jgi:glycosyltransferase involved in cell wall biosynthesis